MTGESGYLASEGFPNLYPPNKECIWTITVRRPPWPLPPRQSPVKVSRVAKGLTAEGTPLPSPEAQPPLPGEVQALRLWSVMASVMASEPVVTRVKYPHTFPQRLHLHSKLHACRSSLSTDLGSRPLPKPSTPHPDGVPSPLGPISIETAWGKGRALGPVVLGLTLRVPIPVPTIRSLRARLCPSPSESLTWSCTPPAGTMLWRSLPGQEPRVSGSDASAEPSGRRP